MQITIQISGDKLIHAKPAQFGAIVAHVMKSQKFHNVQVYKTMIAISFNLEDFSTLGALEQRSNDLKKDIFALLDLEPFPCPCGCGQFLAIGPCFEQSGDLVRGQELTSDEMIVARDGLKIQAIKMVRERTGLGLKDAKDLVDSFSPERYSTVSREAAAKAQNIYDCWNLRSPTDFRP